MGKVVKKLWHFIVLAIFLGIFGVVVYLLFFGGDLNKLIQPIKNFLGEGNQEEQMNLLRIVYPEDPLNLNPGNLGLPARQRLINIYEPLVKTDRSLRIQPALAISWGAIDDYTWEFRLRPGVKFHNGTEFNAEDVIFSFNYAKSHADSDLKDYLSTIKTVEIIDEDIVRIETFEPDPLILQKLTLVFILPSEYEKLGVNNLIGTGPYAFSDYNEEKIILTKNASYWREEPKFPKIELYSKTDRWQRIYQFLSGGADLMIFVPYDIAFMVEERGYRLVSAPGLEVQFLLFNNNRSFFANINNRKAFSLGIDQAELISLVGGYAMEVNQFVGDGIFGFNPGIAPQEYNPQLAADIFKETNFYGKSLEFHLLNGLDLLGEYLARTMSEVGIQVNVSYLSLEDLLESVENGLADLYFFGFRSDLADSMEFFDAVVNFGGQYHVGDYADEDLIDLIEMSNNELDFELRQQYLQQAMEIIVEEKIIGVPLFEYETLYAFNDLITLKPRFDGLIYFDELIVNK